MTRPRKKLLIALASFIAAIAAFLVIEHFRGPWLLNRWKKRMIARGEIFDIDKLARPALPPQSNGLPQLVWAAGQLSVFPLQRQPPVAKYLAPGKIVAITRLNQWPLSEPRGTNASWVEVAEQLVLLDGSLQQVLDILASERFSANLHYRAGFNLPIMHLSRLKSASQALAAATLHDLHQGQLDAAFAKLNGMLALVEVEKDEPIIISQLVRIAMMHTTCFVTWHALQHDGWSDAQLAQLQKTWASLRFLRELENAMCMERAMASIEYENFRTSELPLSYFADPSAFVAAGAGAAGPTLLSWNWLADFFDNFPDAFRDHAFTPVWKFAWSHHDELHYFNVIQSMLDAQREVRSQKAGALLPPRLDRVDDLALKSYLTSLTPVARMIYPALSRAFQRAWIAQAAAELAATAIAIKRFHLRHRSLPATLADLVPEIFPEYPIDHMDGQQLKYCLENDSTFLLYSVGIDGKDDGGDGSRPRGELPNFQYGLDLVWPRPASEQEQAVWIITIGPKAGSRRP